MDSNKFLEKISDSIEDAIKPIIAKGAAMTPADLENIAKAVCIVEKISRIEDGNSYDDGGFSENGYSYNDNSNSYRRGRSPYTGRFVSRDTMPYHDDGGNSGRYYNVGNSSRSYGGGNMSRNYSGHSRNDMTIYHIENLMDAAQTEQERHYLSEWLRRVKNV